MTYSADDDLRQLIRRMLNLREQRAEITADIALVGKEAKSRGYDAKKIGEVCRWLEKCDKHGRAAMIEAESLFDLYRDVAEGPSRPIAELFEAARDKALAEIFASPPEAPKPSARSKAAGVALAYAAVSRMNRGRA